MLFGKYLSLKAQSFLGILELNHSLIARVVARVAEEGERTREAFFTSRDSKEGPALATVTILCDTPSDDAEGKTVRTTFGGEVFLSPGQSHTLRIPYSQRLVANCTYFVSGHPNILVTSFMVGNNHKTASDCGTKYGQCSFVVEVGQQIQVRLEYRVPGQSL